MSTSAGRLSWSGRLSSSGPEKRRQILRMCHDSCHVGIDAITNRSQAAKTHHLQAFTCARVDSNHHGPFGPQGPQPCPRPQDASASVQIVCFVRFPGRIGRNGRSECCHDVATAWPVKSPPASYAAAGGRLRGGAMRERAADESLILVFVQLRRASGVGRRARVHGKLGREACPSRASA